MSILAIGAHPDDIEIGCGGTIRKLIESGEKVCFLIVTDGSAGHAKMLPAKLAAKRKKEALNAAEVLGVSELIFLDLDDGLVTYSKEIKLKLVKLIRELKAKTIFVHSSTDRFSDHRLVHDLVLSAVSVSGGPWFSHIKTKPHSVEKVLGYEVWHPLNHYELAIDITSSIDLKLASLREHESQMEGINYIEAVEGLGRYRGVMSGIGKYAEVFEVIKTSFS